MVGRVSAFYAAAFGGFRPGERQGVAGMIVICRDFRASIRKHRRLFYGS
jgi:hypothetical protein